MLALILIAIVGIITGGFFGLLIGLVHAFFILRRFTFPLTLVIILFLIFGLEKLLVIAGLLLLFIVIAGVIIIKAALNENK
ncbi:sulfite-cytochrome c oxidoreductase subunit B [Weissella oryzae SG25]|uniref:Sulfite-cytochrome c oxidoreductase subunit B n=1 Tax=Weissella oryzae (strain DSM 25784 / JCM 18191 / LMG 30913 / SG25) TaxID=1329250 RepID=A0A069CUT6_WEIOS|nr:hypothetical protein [Weissella oryzae]GAK31570.1 sulfite-cytochrome c oxidoreductase subunit B [Weissella oryzae SG25]